MGSATLTVDLAAIAANWRALDAMSGADVETGAVVKADGYGLGAGRAALALARAGARRFFVAIAEEGAKVRQAVGPAPQICVFSGHMPGDTDMIGDLDLTPMLNSVDQVTRHFESLPGKPFGIQLDSGMNRLGLETAEWEALAPIVLPARPVMLMSHLACADEPDHPMNRAQLDAFLAMTEGTEIKRSLAATGGILLGPDYHLDITRPGIGLYGGHPFADAAPAARLSIPVIQTRDLEAGEVVGYGATWTAERPTKLATIAAGYADGVIRALSNNAMLWSDETPCPLVGRVSMDLVTVDVTHLPELPRSLDLLSDHQTIDDLARAAGTIGYEILTALGARYSRRYTDNPA